MVAALYIGAPAVSEIGIRKSRFVAPKLVNHDLGGSVVSYAQEVSRYRIEGRLIQIVGRCDSACTLFLALPPDQVCITPGASFGFHRAYGSTKSMNDWGTRYLKKSYPRWVQNWLTQNGGLTQNVKRLHFKAASRHIRRCDVRVMASR